MAFCSIPLAPSSIHFGFCYPKSEMKALTRRRWLETGVVLAGAPCACLAAASRECCTIPAVPADAVRIEPGLVTIDLSRTSELSRTGSFIKVVDAARKLNLLVARSAKDRFVALGPDLYPRRRRAHLCAPASAHLLHLLGALQIRAGRQRVALAESAAAEILACLCGRTKGRAARYPRRGPGMKRAMMFAAMSAMAFGQAPKFVAIPAGSFVMGCECRPALFRQSAAPARIFRPAVPNHGRGSHRATVARIRVG